MNDLHDAWNSQPTSESDTGNAYRRSIDSVNPPPLKGEFSLAESIADILPVVFPNALIPVAYAEEPDDVIAQKATPRIRLVILDKDGSLASVYPRWCDWAYEISNR